jgi:hypothetical protein
MVVGLTSPLVGGQGYTTETHITYSSSPLTTYSYTTTSTQSYSTSFTLSARVKNSVYQGTCYSETLGPFDVQSGDVVKGMLHPGPAGVLLGIMGSSTYSGEFAHAQAESCGELISRYSEHIDGNVDSSSVFHFTWKAGSTDQYYFVILNAGYDNDVKVDFSSSLTGGFMVSSTEYQTQIIQQMETLVASILTTQSLQMPQPPQQTAVSSTNNTLQLPLILSVIAAVVIGAAFLYTRRKGQTIRPKVSNAKRIDSAREKNFCIECGRELELGSKFCNNCGTKQP